MEGIEDKMWINGGILMKKEFACEKLWMIGVRFAQCSNIYTQIYPQADMKFADR